MPAIFFGSISTVADTSEMQREAFNAAFRQHDLDLNWSREDYRELLESSGGQQRIAEQSAAQGLDVDAAAVHQTKSELFQQALADSAGVSPRAGVVDTIRAAKADGMKVGFVTTTTEDNVAAILKAVEGEIPASDFDLVLDLTDVASRKPAADVYARALQLLGESAGDCVAIEDNLGGVESAKAAGVACAAFPNENTAAHDFAAADRVVDHLALGELRSLIAA